MQCMYAACMSKTVQVRDLPDDVHEVIRTRAAAAGMSLAEYLRREITSLSRRPLLSDWLTDAATAAQDSPAVPTATIVDALRADRDSR